MQSISRGESFGAKLGSGLGELAGYKIGQLIKKHQQGKERSEFAQTWEPVIGKDSANFLSNLSPDERKYALQNISSLIQLNEPPSSREQVANLGGGIQQLQGQQQPQQQFGPEQLLQALRQPEQLYGKQSNMLQQQPQQQQVQGQQIQQQQAPQQQKMTPDKAKLIEDIFISPQERRERKKLEFAEKTLALKEARAEQVTNIKETKKYIDTLKDKEKAAKESDLRLKRMANLIEKGKLPNANLWSFLSKIEEAGPLAAGGVGALLGSVVPGVGTAVGAGIGGLVGALSGPLAGAAKSFIKTGSPDIEEFEKLSNDFVKNAKQYFGSRLTDADLRVFMQTVPTLMQTDAGKKKVIQNLSSLNELAEIEAKAARSIIRENRGVPPIDIEQQVQDKISNKIDKVAKRFISE